MFLMGPTTAGCGWVGGENPFADDEMRISPPCVKALAIRAFMTVPAVCRWLLRLRHVSRPRTRAAIGMKKPADELTAWLTVKSNYPPQLCNSLPFRSDGFLRTTISKEIKLFIDRIINKNKRKASTED
jgi:hypothetical protein